jgi:hypothetical protein
MESHPKKLLNSEIAGTLLFDRLRRSDVSSAINAHLDAVHADEAQFTNAGVAIDNAAAEETHAIEVKRFDALVRTPCHSPDDVQAKIRYFMHGSVGERSSLIECLSHEQYGLADDMDGVRRLLQSLLLQDPLHAYAREAEIAAEKTFPA